MGRQQNELSVANTTASVQVLGVGSDSGCSVPSVLLFFDRQRFLFNAGEGFQRFCVEHRVRLARVSGVLATRTTTEATGGLPGMLLTMADTSCGGLLAGHAGMSVYGPPGLTTLVNAFRTFVNVRDIGLKVSEFGGAGGGEQAQPVVQSELVTITPVTLAAEGASASEAGAGAEEPQAKRQRVEGGDAAAAPAAGQGSHDIVASVSVESPAACYVCELPDVPGKFLPQKAASLGVPRGPQYGKLVRGEEVTAANGQVVRPADVMEPATPGPVVLVVDCPSAAFLPALTAAPLLQECATGAKRDKVAVVVHLTPLEVLRLPGYRAWLGSFGPEAQHILVAESIGSTAPIMRKSAIVQAKLNGVDPAFFPLHPGPVAEADAELPPRCVVGTNMLRYHLRPLAKKGLDSADCPEGVDVAAVQAELREQQPEVLEAAAAAAAPAPAGEAVPACVASGARDEWEVTFLGTGAAVPSKYRNVTGIHVNLFARGGMLMDCGEGSYGQLKRRFGSAAADELIKTLRLIWISHIHADHHVGLPAVLASRTRLLGPDCEPLLVLGPRPLRRALQGYAQLEPMRFRFLEASATAGPPPPGAPQPPEPSPEARAAIDGALAALGLTRLESVLVAHCAHAYGLVLERGEGVEGGRGPWKLVFSGDTRPCPQLVEAARGATLLIHEATFEDSLADEAVAKKHCTTSEAVAAGAEAGAYRTLLTHFSQRYPKIPVVDQNFQGTVGIAFDLMSVNLADVPRLPAIVPALKLLFTEREQEEDDEEPEPAMLG